MSNEQEKSNIVLPTPSPEPPPQNAEVTVPEAVGVVKINFDEIKNNSVIIIKISPEGIQQRIAATQQIAMALRPLSSLIRSKNVSIIVMSTSENMEVLEEEQMNSLGWHKKEESRIIIPR